ncbi:hypothetical protein Btru_016707 [Bulinus truncatus]|nr:hypothetical protein Btru_016707 [Bulinus truncatus]
MSSPEEEILKNVTSHFDQFTHYLKKLNVKLYEQQIDLSTERKIIWEIPEIFKPKVLSIVEVAFTFILDLTKKVLDKLDQTFSQNDWFVKLKTNLGNQMDFLKNDVELMSKTELPKASSPGIGGGNHNESNPFLLFKSKKMKLTGETFRFQLCFLVSSNASKLWNHNLTTKNILLTKATQAR